MSENTATALEKIRWETSSDLRPQPGFNEMIQQAPQQQGLTPTVVPLDRETLTFYGNMITAANLVPQESGVTPEISKYRVMAKIVAGVSYGFDPVLSQSCFDVLFNRMTPNAHGMEILFRDSGEYDTRIKQLDDEACVITVIKQEGGTWNESRGRFEGGTWRVLGEVSFTWEMAKEAKLAEKDIWQKYRRDMMYAKVMKRVVKRYNPGCLRPRTLLGNYFAKQSAPPQPETPLLETSQSPAPEVEPYIDPPFVADPEDAGEATITEYSGPPIEEERPEIDPEESRLADLRTAVSDKYAEMSKTTETKKLANEFLGQRLLKDLTPEEQQEFLDKQF